MKTLCLANCASGSWGRIIKTKYNKMNLMSKLRILLLLLTISLNVVSQKITNNFALTLDILGNGGLYSVNGEYKIGKINSYQVNARAGFGYYDVNNEGFVSIPIGLNLLTGTKNHHLELGLGASYVNGLPFASYKMAATASEGIYFVPSIGYRYDKLTSGLIFKVYYSPFITVYDFFNEEKYIDKLLQMLNENVTNGQMIREVVTREQIIQSEANGFIDYPTIKNRFGYFGVTVGYRF